jgi:hypothetical protein
VVFLRLLPTECFVLYRTELRGQIAGRVEMHKVQLGVVLNVPVFPSVRPALRSAIHSVFFDVARDHFPPR